MGRPFCHVHNHTEYSLLDGANRIPDMVAYAKESGMDALAISDHGVMFGVMEFYFECKKRDVKPILGVEAYVAPGGHLNKKGREEGQAFHLLLLAKNLAGYQNLCKLSTIAALEGYYYKPRIDHELLRRHREGLIGTSACLGSEICQQLMAGQYDKAQYLAGMYKELFEEDSFFIELQDHRIPEQAAIKDSLLRIAREVKLPLVATNDAHYRCRGDAKPHDVLLCIQTGALVAEEQRLKFETNEFYLKTPEEMEALFSDTPEALENTVRIAEMCNVELDKRRAPMPQPECPEGMETAAYLRQLAFEGLARSRHADQAVERLEYELGVIEKTGFQDYFLLVREFAKATRDRGIFFGVRGSAAGSLVSYAIGITDVDPVEYDLTFERFLNPERISMPDIDMDFEDARRDEIIQYVTERFGSDRVAQIVTFGTLGAKAAIKDCGRVLGYTPQETDRLCKLIPTLPGWSIDRAMSELPEFRQAVEADPRVQDLIQTAKSVEGMARHAGVHAAGVVISRDPLVEYVPLYRGNDGQPVTAFEMGILEKIGMLKMDFLGLSNLTVLARCIANMRRGGKVGADFDIRAIPDDEKTYEMLGRGETVGVFQLEGGGMTRYVQQLKPQSVRELAAMVALYRPGPMEHIPTYIDTKFGRRQAVYLEERMRPILEETYGVIVYQDQVLKLVQALAGFTLGKADILRRAMGKKDAKAMAEMQKEFQAGAAEHGISEDTASRVWELLLPFAGYAFNKAHAVCYAILAYQTAYLKANYPAEYMAALLSVYLAKEDRVVAFIEECRRLKIPVLPPDVNASVADFNLTPEGAIRFGMVAIKGVGEGVVEAIVKEREENGPFVHLYEFCERLKPYGINRTAVEALIKAGAFDAINKNRRALLDVVDGALQFADQANKERLAGQDSLFGEGGPAAVSYPVLPDPPAPGRTEQLSMEKEVMGIYVSDHPLRGLDRLLRQSATHTCQAIPEQEDGTFVKVAGVLSGVRSMVTKSKGERMAILTLEDFTGQVSATVFPATYAKLREVLLKDSVVQLTGWASHRDRPGNGGEKTIEIRVEDVKPLDPTLDIDFLPDQAAAGTMTIRLYRATSEQLLKLKGILAEAPGEHEVVVQVMPDTDYLPMYLPFHVRGTSEVADQIRASVVRAEVEIVESRFRNHAHAL